ncbi:hypothetical protein BX070DRAFT_229767 [Coemansia spiralis]|nr:hypothetical protein BX070DRAFT_229767 [Coemansia spiralis]
MPGTRLPLSAAFFVLSLATTASAAYVAANTNMDGWRVHAAPYMHILGAWGNNTAFRNSNDDDDDDSLLTALILLVAICGTIVGIGFVFTMIFACVQLFKAVRWRLFGVDENGVSERMRDQMLSDEDSRQSYELALAFERQYPYGSINTQLTPEQQSLIRERGVDAWEFVVNLEVNALLQSKTDVLFMGGENCVQTNLPLPKANSVYYFEVKIVEKPADVNMWIGMATKPYPAWRMAGWNKYSAGYCVNNGIVHQNSPFKGTRIGEQLFVGDILGIGYQPRSGVVWFTRNGRRFKAIVSGMLYDLFPTISADGPCSFSANFGQRGFVFIEANVKRWGLGPVEGAMVPPPVYGANQNTILLETAVASSGEEDGDDNEEDDDVALIETSRRVRARAARGGADSSSTPMLAESTIIEIDDHARSPRATEPQNIQRSSRRPQGIHRPPQYQKEDPIAAQLLEAGSTSLEPVSPSASDIEEHTPGTSSLH